MSEPSSSSPHHLPRKPRAPLYITLAVVVAFFIGVSVITIRNTNTLHSSAHWVSHTYEVTALLDEILAQMSDAQTRQRGFLITGDEEFLDQYNASLLGVDSRLESLALLTGDNQQQRARLPELRFEVAEKKKDLSETLKIRREEGFDAARDRMLTGRSKATMDAIRVQIAAMKQVEQALLSQRLETSAAALAASNRSAVATGIIGVTLTLVIAWLLESARLAQMRQDWLRAGHTGLSERLMGEQGLEEVSQNSLTFLCHYLDAKAGALFVSESGAFRRAATYAIPNGANIPERFHRGEGLLGQAAKDRRTLQIHDVPDGYLSIGSSLGGEKPRHLLVLPAFVDGETNAVLEFGFLGKLPESSEELLARCAGTIGLAVRAAQSRSRILELLEETQRQAEELQTQSEELRVSNEELEENSRVLKQTQVRLEQQQAELEENNMQLEEQTQLLERQKDDLTQAKLKLENQARVVEQASRYKSDFLANMSHELRTPLNSSLILAQLLAENRTGNLTEEQIKFARTIQSSGNDLLALINDVLDLSKIEAGRMDLRPQPIVLGNLLESLQTQFEPVAKNRGLGLRFSTSAGTPERIESDPQRLEQVLRNLLSNALKFTERGEVSLEVSPAGLGRIALSVRDTGIGIELRQQKIIFEPFCQADGTTSRKYGGTGLGLSISRELARLLGGEIRLQSEVGRGSTFTIVIPEKFGGPATSPVTPAPEVPSAEPGRVPKVEAPKTSDDREVLKPVGRVILVVEDDSRYAEVLATLARERNFQCIVSATAQEAMKLAREHAPSAVLLDIGLPDGSGLMVLEQLKNDPRTRHIPVHIVSGSDYTDKALAMGAMGYMLKPVTREQITDALQALEEKLTQTMRRVLVVEDDPVQRDALCKLLASREVEAIGAQSAEDCLSNLQSSTFDCVVLDLSLPDASGFALLKKLSEDDAYPFPPVIIYTGRELNEEEEQVLRRYSKSIIIKGAKSPERLLDEVALFLHQVVADLPAEKQRMIEKSRSREAALEGRRVLLVEDDVRNVFAITSLLEPLGVHLEIARNGLEALAALERAQGRKAPPIDLVLMDIMMPEMDGLTATREIRRQQQWQKLPIIALTAKAMPNDQEKCIAAGVNDYLAKPLDIEKLLSLIRVWMPR